MENLDSLKIASNLLRSHREKLNLSIKEISLELRLEETIIRDIESANFDNFSSYLFLKGYLKNYADFLEIKINLPEYKERKKPKIKKEKNKVVRKSYINYILALIVLVLIYFFLIENNKIVPESENKTILIQKDSVSRDKDDAEKIYKEEKTDNIITPYKETIESLSKEIDSKLEVIINDSKENLNEKSTADSNEKPLELIQDQILIIKYSDDSWTEIINSNGDIVFFDLVKGGKSIKIKILTPFEILLGDATAVNIKYNNKVVKIPYFNPDNNVGKIKINN
ncbi:MAG: DUF4115 domain-containing protein [Gammaproteobacteria bacterium]|jgi:cytoskeleton protein RodZ|nr:DUF4115 domain-containing protein [Gammaproteobacteria bacterium]MBT6754520.1 DUF4115 domain-containing protein [Gammaproteobacteria bacterium]MBT7523673.1 DUF4115 domain-containing protein [Gammaproteobacteria bacterium]